MQCQVVIDIIHSSHEEISIYSIFWFQAYTLGQNVMWTCDAINLIPNKKMRY